VIFILETIEDTIDCEGSEVKPKSAIRVPPDKDAISWLLYKAPAIMDLTLVLRAGTFCLIVLLNALAKPLFTRAAI
jgi:hypothetical protein